MTNPEYNQYPQQPQPYQQPVYQQQPQYYYPAPVQQTTVVGTGAPGVPHVAHLILTLLTCGLWAPVWIIDALIRGRR